MSTTTAPRRACASWVSKPSWQSVIPCAVDGSGAVGRGAAAALPVEASVASETAASQARRRDVSPPDYSQARRIRTVPLLDRRGGTASARVLGRVVTFGYVGSVLGPLLIGGLGGTISEAAWRSKPSWYLVATDDRMIPPPAQRSMAERAGATVVEVAGSHSIFLSQPAAVAGLIEQAASEVLSGTR